MERVVKFTKEAEKDLKYWKKTKNKQVLKRIKELIQSIQESYYTGIGNPEELKYEYSGNWSRRITKEHRLIYVVIDDVIYIKSLRFHYK